MTDVTPHLRWLIRRDMPEVLAIEESGFVDPWTEDGFLRHLRQRNGIGMVAEYQERVVGYMLYELHPNKLRLVNHAVDPDFRRRGIGSALIHKLMTKLSPTRRTRIVVEVRESNLSAQLFSRALGFKAIAVLPEFWDGTDEAAYRMVYRPPINELTGEPLIVIDD